MNTNRRGFLGLLGASAAAVPFLGQAVGLKADPVTGSLTVDGPRQIVELPQVAGDFLVIPAASLRSVAIEQERDYIDVSRIGGPPREFAPFISQTRMRLELSAYGDDAYDLCSQIMRVINERQPMRWQR